MGLLDDAIREHLELKRKHGANDEELQRQETEALGPARRDFSTTDTVAEAPVEAVPAQAGAPTLEPEPRGWLDEEETPAPPAPAEPVPGPVPTEPPAPAPAAEAVEPLEHAAEALDPAMPAEPVPAPEPAPPLRASDTPTQGFDALRVDDDDADDASEEDVLEETPDFLQDTPEHDRLWFEQKPPRDFDFDE